MSIIYNENAGSFTIHTNNTTYQMKVDSYGILLHLYYGRKAVGEMDFLLNYGDRGFSGNLYDADQVRTYSLDFLPQEYPTSGTGDYRMTALSVDYSDGTFGCDLRYDSYEIHNGKYSIPGLPAVYAAEEESETLIIHMKDRFNGLAVDLYYGAIPALDIITRSVRVVNNLGQKIILNRCQSAVLDFLYGEYDLVTFYGRHCMERNVQRSAVGHGAQVIGSRRGTSSHHYNPMLILAEDTATETSGTCYSMNFLYSGGFMAGVEKDQMNQTRMWMGLMDENFRYTLDAGETFETPEVVLTCSIDGFETLSHNLHNCIRKHICRGKYRDGGRPILLNSWEASYFDFTGESIAALAEQAADLGVDMLVMDDGWFGVRNDDHSGLGDWYVNEEKLGCSLGELIHRINGMGLKFGIWFEPEAINENSDLFRAHPDWAFRVPGRDPIRSRDQLILDFSRKEVVDHIFESMCKVMDQGNIEYVKWDLNRSLFGCYSKSGKNEGMVMHEYVLGVYDLAERLIRRYPNMLLEGCSGGGGRFDAGMLYYSPQIWTSDNTDALDRQLIQYGTSFGYPACTMASHVSAVPNHQTGRITPLEMRGITAMAGTFGYELNPAKMSDTEKSDVRKQIEEYRRFEHLVYGGDYYRLTNPAKDMVAAWAFVSEDKSEALVQAAARDIHGNMPVNAVRVRGLRSGSLYRDTVTGKTYSSDALAQVGLPLEYRLEANSTYQFHLEVIE